MPGIFSLSRRVLGAAAALTLGATLTATAATAASAGAATAPISPTQTRGEQFFCDLSGYGGGITADQTITFTETSVVEAGQPAATTVSIPAVPLTAAASAQLASADRYTLSVSFTATDTSASTDDTGSEAAAASPAAAIPALTGTGSVTFRAAGHAYINDITGFEITPSAGGTAMAPIKC